MVFVIMTEDLWSNIEGGLCGPYSPFRIRHQMTILTQLGAAATAVTVQVDCRPTP